MLIDNDRHLFIVALEGEEDDAAVLMWLRMIVEAIFRGRGRAYDIPDLPPESMRRLTGVERPEAVRTVALSTETLNAITNAPREWILDTLEHAFRLHRIHIVENQAGPCPLPPPAPVVPLAKLEEEAIRNALRVHGGRVERAAKALEIGRATLYRRIQGYGLDVTNYRPEPEEKEGTPA